MSNEEQQADGAAWDQLPDGPLVPSGDEWENLFSAEPEGYTLTPFPPAPPAEPAALVHRSPEAVWSKIGDQLVVYLPATTTSYVLNSVAGLVWQCLDGDSPLDEVLADVADVFGVDSELVLDDFLPVVGQWIADEIAETVPGEPRDDCETTTDPWRRLDSPPNECGRAELARWPNRIVVGINGTAITVASDQRQIIDSLRPWQIDLETQLVDYVLETEPPDIADQPSLRKLASISNGCDPLFRLRDTEILVETFWRMLASFRRPESPGQIRVRMMPIVRDGVALLVPPGHAGMISHRWYEAQSMEPLYTATSVIDVASWTVRVDRSLLAGTKPGGDLEPAYPILHWWLPSADPSAGITPGDAVAHVMRWCFGTDAQNAGQVLTDIATAVAIQLPGLAPLAIERIVEQITPTVATELRHELMDAIVARFNVTA